MPTRAWNELDPTDNDDVSSGAQEIRELKADVRDRMSLEHLFGLLVGSTDAGMHVWDYKAKAGAYQLATTDHLILATQGATLTLPAVSSANKGKAFAIKVSGVGTVTVARTGGDTIDGAAASLSLVGVAAGGALVYLVSDGVSNWVSFMYYDPRAVLALSGTPGATNFLRGDGAWISAPAVCLLRKDADQDMVVNTQTQITWTVEDSDALAAHTPNASTITVPAGYTFINITAKIAFAAVASDSGYIHLFHNGVDKGSWYVLCSTSNRSNINVATGWIPVVAGDSFYLTAFFLATNPSVRGAADEYSFLCAEFR